MLKLTRREGESITIGDNITIKILKISPQIVFIGIEAPSRVPIVRDDAINKKKRTDRPGLAENKKRSAV